VWLAKTLRCSIGAAKAQYRLQHMTSEQLQRSRDQAKADAPHKCAGTRCRPQSRRSQPEPLDGSGVISLSRSHHLTGVAIHAGQQETNMAATDRFEIPPEMRALAEKSVEQARQAFDSFISAAHRAVSAFEGQAETARRGAKDVTENAMTFAQHNIASSFELAEQLVRARDVEEVLKLQADYIKRQMQLFSEQARELGERTSATAKDATTPNQG